MSPLAALVLRAVRREVGRRAAAGGPTEALDAERLARRVEADPEADALLDAAVAEARREFAYDAPPEVTGPRARRRARTDRALAAVDELLLAGELAPDGPGRVVLPGFGASTWRAAALLRAGAGGAERAWAAAVVAEPFADLGPDAPAAPDPDPRLLAPARAVHAREAARQDVRDALIRAEAAARDVAARGGRDGVRALRDDVRALEAALAGIDAALAACWEAGLRRAEGSG